jgi:pilus assembly protein Flp/PilA
MKSTRTDAPKQRDLLPGSSAIIDAQAGPMKMPAPEIPVRKQKPRDFQVEALKSAIAGKLKSAKSDTLSYRKVIGEEEATRVIKALNKTIELVERDAAWDHAIKALDAVSGMLTPIIDRFDDDCFDYDLQQLDNLEEAAQMMGAAHRLQQAEELLRENGFIRKPKRNTWVSSKREPAVRSIVFDEDGATMVEYGLLVALIAMVALVAVQTLGTTLSSLFNNVASSI